MEFYLIFRGQVYFLKKVCGYFKSKQKDSSHVAVLLEMHRIKKNEFKTLVLDSTYNDDNLKKTHSRSSFLMILKLILKLLQSALQALCSLIFLYQKLNFNIYA